MMHFGNGDKPNALCYWNKIDCWSAYIILLQLRHSFKNSSVFTGTYSNFSY